MKQNIFQCSIFICLLCILPFLIESCKKKSSDISIFTIGQSYQGGKIFFIDNTGLHGYVAATSDQSNATTWYNGTVMTTNAISPLDGASNTTLIVTKFGNTGLYAAKICKDYRGGNYDDWFLPAKDQLKLMYEQKGKIGGFLNVGYWSSTESSLNGYAWYQDFSFGTQDNLSVNNYSQHVRAIRAF